MLLALQAVAAAAARAARIDGDALAGLDAVDLRADAADRAGDLVAEDHRLLQPHGAEPAVEIVVQVRAADAAGLDAHLDVVRAHRGQRRRIRSAGPWAHEAPRRACHSLRFVSPAYTSIVGRAPARHTGISHEQAVRSHRPHRARHRLEPRHRPRHRARLRRGRRPRRRQRAGREGRGAGREGARAERGRGAVRCVGPRGGRGGGRQDREGGRADRHPGQQCRHAEARRRSSTIRRRTGA